MLGDEAEQLMDNDVKIAEKGDGEDADREDASNSTHLLSSSENSSQTLSMLKSGSVTEISLSPSHLTSDLDGGPAVVNIDTLEAEDDVIITKDFGKNEKLIITDRSSIMEAEKADNSMVCGSNGWCSVS